MKEPTAWQRASVVATNWALALTYGLFAVAHVRKFIEHPRLSFLLIVLIETLLVVFLLIRRNPDRTWHSWQTWLTTAGGTIFPLLVRGTSARADLPAGEIVQITGFCLQIGATLSLNRCFGLLPAHRGVASGGLYRFVRHPIYAAHTLSFLGYLISNFNVYNATVFVAGVAFQVLRIYNEERLLLGYADYVALVRSTRWRLVPFVW
jgi:protein-S-isoprenylcysteine O-methyltransferase Ste14